MKIAIYDKTGKKTEGTVSTKIFDGKENQALLAEALHIMRSNRRQTGAKTLDRSEVSGGGRKPWRQKGTGRARAGSSRSPIWRGGGVTFGPTGEQNFKLQMPKKKKKAALMSALATKKDADILAIKEIKLEKPSTKIFAGLFKKLDINRNVLIVAEKNDENISKSLRNLQNVKLTDYKNLNAYDVMWARKMVFIGESLALVSKLIG